MHVYLDTITSISIHVPREGDDVLALPPPGQQQDFNPRPP